jgi:hypothetical protein
MFQRTHIPEARWWVVDGDDKKHARLNCISHLLDQIPYQDIEQPEIILPERERHEGYVRHPVPADLYVPQCY